jgi:hypothetical protein
MQLCFKLGKTSAERHEMPVTAYGSDAVAKKTVFMLKETVHSEFVPRCQTVFSAFYEEVLQRMREAIRLERRLNAPSRQRAMPHTTLHLPVFGG